MEAGLVLSQFVFSRMNVEAVVPHLLIQINRIQILLKKLKIAHCDIKPENMIVTYSHEQGIQVKLIDMDYAVSFGEMRVIGTRRLNVLDHIDDFGNYATSVTDDYGFIYVKNFLYAQYMFPFLR
jgi:serine/threonine protein kinase